MDETGDMDPKDVCALEERLYSQFHHSYEVTSTSGETLPSSAVNGPTRVVTKTCVVNNAQPTHLLSKRKRYWGTMDGVPSGEKPVYPNTSHSCPGTSPPATMETNDKEPLGMANVHKKMFLAPYQSLLGNSPQNFSSNLQNRQEENNAPTFTNMSSSAKKTQERSPKAKHPKKKPQPTRNLQMAQHRIEKKLAGLMKLVGNGKNNGKRRAQFEVKKSKAALARQRTAQTIVAQIDLASSDEDSKCQPVALRAKNAQSSPEAQSDEEADDVVIVPLPEPPKICIDCSDDEVAQDSFAFPHAKKSTKKATGSKINSPRCISPSNSSIMSDDFIGHHERSRLNDSFAESIPNDDELECSLAARRAGDTRKEKADTIGSRNKRAPSISSDGTVCTSSDTTDQEKRLQDTSQGNVSKSSLPSRKELGSIGEKDDLRNRKAMPKSAKKTKLIDEGQQENVKEHTISPSPKGTTKKGAARKTAPILLAKDPVAEKSRSNCKSPVSIAMELTRRHFETDNSTENIFQGTKKKGKKDRTSDVNKKNGSKKNSKKKTIKTSQAGSLCQLVAPSNATKSTGALLLDDDSVSSESDYELTLVKHKECLPNRRQSLETSATREASAKKSPVNILPALDRMEDVSSESDYQESFTKAVKSTPKPAKDGKKRVGRKRKQYNSENYSDEDFACMLTDIVRAVSDTDAEEEDNEQELEEEPEQEQEQEEEQEHEQEHDEIQEQDHHNEQQQKADRSKEPEEESEPKKTTSKADGRSTKKKKRVTDTSEYSLVNVVVGGNVNDEAQRFEENLVTIDLDCEAGNEQTNPASGYRSQRDCGVKGVENSVTHPADCAWNEEMKLFYNGVWMDKDFSLGSVMQQMPRGRKHWEILQQDLYPDRPQRQVLCNNCGEQGHLRNKCRNPRKPRICFMCGEQGHAEPRCPNTICLNCGARTRSFVRGCNACYRELHRNCRLCGVRGHSYYSCPDMWRRYHSTTEDNVRLTSYFVANNAEKYCCICCKRGHQAHACNAAYRIFGMAVPTAFIQSYEQIYSGYQQRNDKAVPEQEIASRFNLFSEQANDSELNLYELAENTKGFYYRFAKSTGLLAKHQLLLNQQKEAMNQWLLQQSEQPRQQEQEQEQEQQEEPQQEEQEQQKEPQQPTEQEQHILDVLDVASTSVEPQNEIATVEATNSKHPSPNENCLPIDSSVLGMEDSNYSFSELLAEDGKNGTSVHRAIVETESESISVDKDAATGTHEVMLPQTTEPCPDFIPLTGSEPLQPEQPVPAETANSISIARIFLTRPHARILLSKRGAVFLDEASKKHSVKLSISSRAKQGNVLVIEGEIQSQDNFHAELGHFLEVVPFETTYHMPPCLELVPRKQQQVMQLVTEKFLQLARPHKDVRDIFNDYKNTVQNTKHQQIARCTLNLVLFGQYGLRDGRKHLATLRQTLLQLMTRTHHNTLLTAGQRSVIGKAIEYIFTPYDHIEYKEILDEYEVLQRAGQLHKFAWADLRLPHFPGGKRAYERYKNGVGHRFNMYGNPLGFDGVKYYGCNGMGDNEMRIEDGSLPSPSQNVTEEGNTLPNRITDQVIDGNKLSALDNATRDVHDGQTAHRMSVPYSEHIENVAKPANRRQARFVDPYHRQRTKTNRSDSRPTATSAYQYHPANKTEGFMCTTKTRVRELERIAFNRLLRSCELEELLRLRKELHTQRFGR